MISIRCRHVLPILFGFTAGCVGSSARSSEQCTQAVIRPIVIVQNSIAKKPVELAAERVLGSMGLVGRQGRFYFTDSRCYVGLRWGPKNRLTILPFIGKSSSMNAEQFSDTFRADLIRELTRSDIKRGVIVTEEIVLQD